MDGKVVGLCPTVNGMNVDELVFQLTACSSQAIPESSPKLTNEEEDVRLVEVAACCPGKGFLPFWLSLVEIDITFPAGMSVNNGKSDAGLLPAIITRLADEG